MNQLWVAKDADRILRRDVAAPRRTTVVQREEVTTTQREEATTTQREEVTTPRDTRMAASECIQSNKQYKYLDSV